MKKIILILLFLLLFTQVKFFVWGETNEETLIVSFIKKPDDILPTVKSIRRVKGIGRKFPRSFNSLNKGKTFEVAEVLNNKEVENLTFQLNDYLPGLPPYPNSKEKYGDPPKIFPYPEATIEIPYQSGAKLNLIDSSSKNKKEISADTINLAPVVKPEINSLSSIIYPFKLSTTSLPETAQTDRYFDIVYISSHYTDFNLFAADVNALSSFLLNVYPFSFFTSSIRILRINNTTDMGCHYDTAIPRLIPCDSTAVLAVASQVHHDAIVVVENNNTYGGAGYLGSYAVTYRDVNAWAREVAVHEMGHAIGYLGDEYDYGYGNSGGYIPYNPNCDLTPCPKWKGVLETGCYQVCGYSDYYRPTYNSCLMRTLTPDTGYKFDNVDKEVMRQIILAATVPTLTPTPTPLWGDQNGDATIDYRDLEILLTFYAGEDNIADLNKDGKVNGVDFGILRGQIQ